MHDAVTVPDIAGALVGWRCWGIAKTKSGILLASHGGTIWSAGTPLEADCPTGKKHDPPAENCTCGIYALAEHEGFPYYDYDGPAYAVFGQVHLWGDVVRGSKGYRAKYAYPKNLYLAHKDWQFVQPLQEAYRVPVHLRNPFAKEAI